MSQEHYPEFAAQPDVISDKTDAVLDEKASLLAALWQNNGDHETARNIRLMLTELGGTDDETYRRATDLIRADREGLAGSIVDLE